MHRANTDASSAPHTTHSRSVILFNPPEQQQLSCSLGNYSSRIFQEFTVHYASQDNASASVNKSSAFLNKIFQRCSYRGDKVLGLFYTLTADSYRLADLRHTGRKGDECLHYRLRTENNIPEICRGFSVRYLPAVYCAYYGLLVYGIFVFDKRRHEHAGIVYIILQYLNGFPLFILNEDNTFFYAQRVHEYFCTVNKLFWSLKQQSVERGRVNIMLAAIYNDSFQITLMLREFYIHGFLIKAIDNGVLLQKRTYLICG